MVDQEVSEIEEGRGEPSREEREATIRLALGEGIGPATVAVLRQAFGSAAAALEASPQAWTAALGWVPGRVERARATVAATDVEQLLKDAEAVGARPLLDIDQGYPALLRAIPDPPPVLWVCGSLEPADDWSVAIVGSRRCSAYGLDQAAAMARGLVECGHTIVSGGARGIDAEAHRAALRAGGRTIAVLGSGCACPYPPEHAPLFAEIAASGAVVSEHAPSVEARSGFFPRRNRIIAGLAIAVLLVEARARSGASITARLAVEDLGRDVLAVPGRVDMPTSEGTHRAIREGWAALVTGAADVIQHLRERGAPAHLIAGARRASAASSRESVLFGADQAPDVDPERDALAIEIGTMLRERGPLALDPLVHALARPAGDVLAQLTILELRGYLRRNSEGLWEARAACAKGSAGPAPPRPRSHPPPMRPPSQPA